MSPHVTMVIIIELVRYLFLFLKVLRAQGTFFFNFIFSEFAICETDLPSQTTDGKRCPPAHQPCWPSSLPTAQCAGGGRRRVFDVKGTLACDQLSLPI